MTTFGKNIGIMRKSFLAAVLGTVIGVSGCKAQNPNIASVGVDGFEKAILDPQVLLIDVRTPEEYAEGHIPGAINVDVRENGFMDRIFRIMTRDMRAAVYCRSGNRSKTARDMLAGYGYMVYELDPGFIAWTEAGKPVVRDESDVFLTPNGTTIVLYCIKHGSIGMKIADKWIYVDPVGRAAQPATDYSILPKADAILITHEHGDHLDADAIGQLTGDDTRIFATANCCKQLGRGDAMAPGDVRTLDGGIGIKAVPAYNTSADRQNFHPKGRDNGYLLTVDGFTIYVAGDTEDIPEMKDLPAVDVAFLPCNLPYTMSPEQLDNAARTIGPKVLFPYHYSSTDMTKVTDMLEGSGIDVRIRRYQ